MNSAKEKYKEALAKGMTALGRVCTLVVSVLLG